MSQWKQLFADLHLDEFIPSFEREQIDDNSLLILNEEDLRQLIPPLGPRRRLSLHIKQLNEGKVPTCLAEIEVPTFTPTGSAIPSVVFESDEGSFETPLSTLRNTTARKRKLPFVNSKNYHFDIEEILKGDEATAKIIDDRVKCGHFIRDQDRNAVSKALVDAILKFEGKYPPKDCMLAIAKDLVRLFPSFGDPRDENGGFEIWYYNEVGCAHATGYLQEKLQNQRRHLGGDKKIESRNSDINLGASGWTSDENDDVISDSDLLYLKTNMSSDEVKEKMRKTVYGRRNLIRSLQPSEIRTQIPRLFDMEGMDFNVRHPLLADNLYKVWPYISRTLLQYCLQTKGFLLESLGIALPIDEWSDDQYGLVGFTLLPLIFSKSGRAAKVPKRWSSRSGGKAKPNLVRISQKDQLDSLLSFVGENVSVLETMTEGIPIYPKILIRGTLRDLSIIQSFIAVQEDVVPTGFSFLSAIDTCFKSFNVLGIDYPCETRACWQFIAYAVFGKKFTVKDPLLAPVRALAGQVLPRLLNH